MLDALDAVLGLFQGWFNSGPPKGLTGQVDTARDCLRAQLKAELEADVVQALAGYIRLKHKWVRDNLLVITHGSSLAQDRPILGFAFEVFNEGDFVFAVHVYGGPKSTTVNTLEPGIKPFVAQALVEVVPGAALRPEPSLRETINKLSRVSQ